jgi:hypothetical protein
MIPGSPMGMRPTSQQPNYTVIVQGGAGSGVFVYNPSQGAGFLVASIAAQGGTDPSGNAYVAGNASYQGISPTDWRAVSMIGQVIDFFTATSAAGPWTQQSSIQGDASGDLTIVPAGWLALDSQVAIGNATGPVTPALLEVEGLVALKGRAAPGSPPSGYGYYYCKASDGSLHYKGASGTDTQVAPG